MDKQVPLPGFRFHPTDEELLSFYLRRKVEKKPVKLGIIREIDIYKYNPWDLSSGCNSGGEKEQYFFCKRGRKYKNSIRPNRVTGCGFWKATGIDKSIYSSAGGASHDSIIGLKKTLVFYRGSAGKGTKTDWMMHEFRLPSDLTTASEAEIWTLCRIFKRNLVPKRHASSYKTFSLTDKISVSASSGESDNGETYISFSPRTIISRSNCEIFPANKHINGWNKQQISRSNCEIFPANKHINGWNKQQHQQLNQGHFSPVAGRTTSSSMVSPPASSFSVDMDADIDLLSYRDWEELRSIVEFALDPSHSPLL